MTEPSAGPKALAGEFAQAGLALSSLELRRFWRLHQLLELRNPDGDLTRVRGFFNLIWKHYIDSTLTADLIRPEGLLMDLGTGAGFPGLPLAIRRPAWRLLLAEPRGRRLAFMEEAVNELGLTNVEFYPHKVTDRFNRPVNDLITRDFESAAATVRRAALILPPGGQIFLMKGPGVERELAEARCLVEWADFETISDRAYALGPGGPARRLITLRKRGRPQPKPQVGAVFPVEIASRENARYKSWLKLKDGRGVKKNSQALISGRKFVKEILRRRPDRVAGLIIRRADDLADWTVPAGQPIYLLRPELWPDLDFFGVGPPLLLLRTAPLEPWTGELAPGLTLFLPLSDPGNLGMVIRSAAALRVPVVLLREAASLWHPKTLRAAGPALLSARLFQGPSLAELAAGSRSNLVGLSLQGRSLLEYEFPESLGLVAGVEGPGLEGTPWVEGLTVPMDPEVESLNAAAAVNVALGVWARASHNNFSDQGRKDGR